MVNDGTKSAPPQRGFLVRPRQGSRSDCGQIHAGMGTDDPLKHKNGDNRLATVVTP